MTLRNASNSTLVPLLQTLEMKAERHIASVHMDGGKGGDRGGGGSSLVDKIKGGNYTDKQFHSLSPEEKQRVQKKEQWKERRKHKAARLKSEHEAGCSREDNETQEAGLNVGVQFGAKGNRKKMKN